MFDALRAQVIQYGVMAVDLETTGLSLDSDILLIAMCAGANVRTSIASAVAPTPEALSFLREMFANPRLKIVGHNILKFDMPLLYRHKIINPREVKALVLDTLPMVWLLNENVPRRLKDSVWRYFKHRMVEYDEAYLTSPALLQMKKIDKQIVEMHKFIERKLPAEARRGASAARRRRLDEIEEETILKGEKRTKKDMICAAKEYAEEWRARFIVETQTRTDRKISSLQHITKRLTIQAQQEQRAYAEDDARQTLRLFRECGKRLSKMGLIPWALCENTVRRIAADMERNGAVIDLDVIERLKAVVIPLISEFEGEVYNISRRNFDINSPAQLSEVIYDDLCVQPIGGKRLDKNRKEIDESRSTKENILARMTHPIGQAVLNYRTVQKLHNSFIVKLPASVREHGDGRIHPAFNTTMRTGRWSCKKPNTQQIPGRKKAETFDERIRKLGPRIRAAFIAPPGKKMIVADLSQIELRLIAHFTEDPMLTEIYNEYVDYEGVRYYTGDIHERTAQMLGIDRSTAKNVNFGLCYGLSAGGFAVRFKVYKPNTFLASGARIPDIEQTTKFRDNFMSYYAGIAEYTHWIKAHRNDIFPKCNFKTISGRFRRFPARENAAPGKILNSIIQGSAADILKIAMIAMDKHIIQEEEFAGTEIIQQVHDEVGLYVPEDKAEQVAVLVKYCLEAPWFQTDVPILSATRVCDNWAASDDLVEVGIIPPKETGIIPCVAMLSQEQRTWAARRVVVTDYTCETTSEEE